jgi:pimeloyl-ACP methyl ester carboxylesterase
VVVAQEVAKMNNYVIPGNSGLPISLDIDYPKEERKSPVILFLHGFKGFKDWGQWPLMAKRLSDQGYVVVRMSFSHNGTTPENPSEFTDLEAFGRNTFSKERQDVDDVVNWLFDNNELHPRLDLDALNIIAHSRGGAIAMISAVEDDRIKKIVTLSGVGTLVRYSEEELAYWKQNGVLYLLNGRTQQNMPLYYELAEDYLKNEHRFDLSLSAQKIQQPFLIIHAEKDETVPLQEGEELAKQVKDVTFKILKDANHSFGGMHPYEISSLPKDTQICVDLIQKFL